MAKGQEKAREGPRSCGGACCCAWPPVAMSAGGKRVNVGMSKESVGVVCIASL